jgi:hypothetical protein
MIARFGIFLAGFGTGWVARSTVTSSRDAAVKMIAGALGAADRVRRAIAMEREHVEDLYAEAQATFRGRRARREGTPETQRAANDSAA